MRLFIATALAATLALPTAASAKETISDHLARGCSVHQVHVPAGKLQINQPVVRCPSDATQVAAKKNAPVKAGARIAAAK